MYPTLADIPLKQTYLGCCVVHHLLGGEVTLVAHQQLVDILAGVAIDLLQPLLHVVVRLLRHTSQRKVGDHPRETGIPSLEDGSLYGLDTSVTGTTREDSGLVMKPTWSVTSYTMMMPWAPL